tara:strand:- start:513 stop:794 length:282 start_codon:yes stop_codon:yes gene_type:complete
MNKNIFILIILVYTFSSCNLIKKNTIQESCISNPVNTKELIEKVNSENISPEWISLNAKIDINQKDNNTQLSAQIRVKKDSLIWVSFKSSPWN